MIVGAGRGAGGNGVMVVVVEVVFTGGDVTTGGFGISGTLTCANASDEIARSVNGKAARNADIGASYYSQTTGWTRPWVLSEEINETA
jgi:hypothetical protein